MTPTTYLTLTPRDPLVARDGRPFAAGFRMRSVDWIYPSVLAGAVRTLVGERSGGFGAGRGTTYDSLVARLKTMDVAGPLPIIDGSLSFPAPRDAWTQQGELDGRESLRVHAARPWSDRPDGCGCDFLDAHGLVPAVLPEHVDPGKPVPTPAIWSREATLKWLLGDTDHANGQADEETFGSLYDAPALDRRVHVQLEPELGTSADGMLFVTTGLDFTRLTRADAPDRAWSKQPEVELGARVRGGNAELAALAEWAPLGGERRLAHWAVDGAQAAKWTTPPRVRAALDALDGTQRPLVRLQLATPAIFEGGWRPGWLSLRDGALVGTVPDTDVSVRLVAACVDRWKPISGWSYEPVPARDPAKAARPGPKPVRRMVAAGSVYFLAVEGGRAGRLADRWLESVCDLPQDRRDGFGLACWGVWSPLPAAGVHREHR